MLMADVLTGEVKRFLVGPSGCEVTGLSFSPDMKSMFVGIQHPGEIGGHPNAPKTAGGSVYGDNDIAREPTKFSTFPDGASAKRPRSTVMVIRRADGGVIGT
jgi:secreted PhoX family phosphatase